MNPNNTAPQFVTYFDFAPYLPHPIPRRQWLRLSAIGKAPACVRPSGFKSEPLFLESEVRRWMADTYRSLLPEWTDQILREGLVMPPTRDRVL